MNRRWGIQIVVLTALMVATIVGSGGSARADAAGSPIGHFDAITTTPGTITAYGWAIDPDSSSHDAALAAFSGGKLVGYTASATQSRPDVGSAFPQYGGGHGFAIGLLLDAGPQVVCVAALNTSGTGGADAFIGCATVDPSNPLGHTDAASATGTSAHVQGWAIDPDVGTPIAVAAYVDGALAGYQAAADGARPDVAAAFPGYGSAHGFDIGFTPPAGTHLVCVAAHNAPGTLGADRFIGCVPVTVAAMAGNVEEVDIVPGGLSVRGWAADTDSPDAATPVAVFDNGALVAYGLASGDRPDVAAARPDLGASHGFELSYRVPAGDHSICVVAYNTPGTNGSAGSIGCPVGYLPPTIGELESVATLGRIDVTGWAIDTSTTGPAGITITMNGSILTRATANADRPDIGADFPGFGDSHGFRILTGFFGLSHYCVYASDAAFTDGHYVLLDCFDT